MPESFLGSVDLRKCLKTAHKAQEHKEHCQCDDQEIALELLAAQYISDLTDQQQLVQAEIDTKQDQEDGHHILREGVEQLHAAGNKSKTTGTGTAEGGK